MTSRFTFTPDETTERIKVPFIEDARADDAPYYSSRASLADAQSQVSMELGKLGGMVMTFVQGAFDINGQRRHGYEIRFMYGGTVGLLRVAGLPIRTETDAKKKQVLKQALLNVRDWLKNERTAKIFNPGHDPLIGHVLLPDGKRTVGDYIREMKSLPALTSEVVDVEVIEA